MRGNRTKRAFLAQPRDLRLLSEAAVLKVFDREQAQVAAPFTSVTRANTRLPLLVKQGLLSRFYLASENGGKKSLYTLTAKGAALAGVADTGIERRKNSILVADLFVIHQLHINDVYLTLKFNPIPLADISFAHWHSFRHQLSNSAPVVPDGWFELSLPSKRLGSFVEVDLGTETAKMWKSKIEAYLQFAVGDDFQRQFKHPQFRVVVIVHSDNRLRSLRKLIANYTEKIFWFSTLEAIKKQGFWAPIWFRPTGSVLKPFVEVDQNATL